MRRDLVLALTLASAYGYFYQAGGWNQNSRFDMVRAVVVDGTLRIDRYAANTGDRSRFNGHFYCDKAPGLQLAAVPIVAAAQPLTRVVGADLESPRGLFLLSWLATFVVSGLSTVFAAVAVCAAARRLGACNDGSIFAMFVFGLGCPMWVYATLFWGHALAAACLTGSYLACLVLAEDRGAKRDLFFGLVAGLGAGWAVVTEFPAGPAAAMLAALALSHAWPGGWPRRCRVAAAVGAGAFVCVGVLAAYHYAAFGSVFQLGYDSVQGFPGMSQGFLGVTYPKLSVLVELLVGSYRGLLPLAPVLVFAPVGFVFLMRAGTRAASLCAAGIVLYYLLLNAAYFYWEGGWCYGPRHLTPILPFLCMFLAVVWSRCGRRSRALLAGLALWGFACTLVGVSTTPTPPRRESKPMTQVLLPAFLAGDLSLNQLGFDDVIPNEDELRGERYSYAAWNLGQLAGLHGLASLLPLMLVFAASGAAIRGGKRIAA